jgi:hypothetical protein
MTVFPRLSSGAVCQYPVQRHWQYRTITNTFEDDSRIVLQDPPASHINWELSYAGISEAELAALQTFFETVEGRLSPFTFVDPAANLLSWSERLDQPVWQANSLLQIQASIGDPLGTTRASRLTNGTTGQLSLVQTISLPEDYSCCWSLYARSDNATSLTLTRSSYSQPGLIGRSWRRVSITATTTGTSGSSDFGLLLDPGETIEVFGMQVEGQSAPSTYVQTSAASAVYPDSRFDSDVFAATAVSPNSHNCRLTVVSRVSP